MILRCYGEKVIFNSKTLNSIVTTLADRLWAVRL